MWNPQIPVEAFDTAVMNRPKTRRTDIMHYADIAQIVHAAVREYNVLHKVPGDNCAWDDMDPAYQISIETGVREQLANPSKTNEESHERWLAERKQGGWVYGSVKDQAKKQHPCMVPYNDLPPVQKFKDKLFREMVHMLRHAPATEE